MSIQMSPLTPFCTSVGCSSVSVSTLSNVSQQARKHRRRYCKYDGCTRIVKSQGLCQRHGAKTRRCKIDGCHKQAQGNFNCMCKAHFKELKKAKEVSMEAIEAAPQGIPTISPLSTMLVPPSATAFISRDAVKSVCETVLLDSIGWSRAEGVMPLIAHLKQGFEISKPEAWHRNDERQLRGLTAVSSVTQELEGWEIDLAWMETLVLTGNADASFQHLASAWGQPKDFHVALGNVICARNLLARPELVAARNANYFKTVDSERSTDVEIIYDESLIDDVIEIFLPRHSSISEIMEPENFPKSFTCAAVGSACSDGSSSDYFTRCTFGEEMDRCDIPVSVPFSQTVDIF